MAPERDGYADRRSEAPRAPDDRRRRRLRLRLTASAVAALCGAALGVGLMAAPGLRNIVADAVDRVGSVVLAQPEFVIRRVEIEGAAHVGDDEILAALGLDGGPINSLDFDAQEARRRVESLGWVSRATVRALPPQLVEVVIEERAPAARWRRDGRLALIDESGVVIADDLDPYNGARGGARLRQIITAPLFVGAGADSAAAEGLRLDEAARAGGLRVLGLTRIGERRWDLELLDGPRIMLPETEPEAALAQFVAWAAETDLLDHGFVVVDFRDPLAPVGRYGESG